MNNLEYSKIKDIIDFETNWLKSVDERTGKVEITVEDVDIAMKAIMDVVEDLKKISDIKSEKPQKKKSDIALWITYSDDTYSCSNCGKTEFTPYNICPRCNNKMMYILPKEVVYGITYD